MAPAQAPESASTGRARITDPDFHLHDDEPTPRPARKKDPTMTLKNILTTSAAAFGGAFWGAITQAPGTAFASRDTAIRVVAGACILGGIAVYHLYEPKPVAK